MSSHTSNTPRRSFRARVLRALGRLGLTVVALVLVASGTVYGLSQRKIASHHQVPEHALVVKSDSATIAQGARLATIRGCVDCHGTNMAGKMIIDDPAIGRLGGANLTNGRTAGLLDDRDWERAVRHGVRRDGTPLLVMPSNEFTGLSDEDLAAIVAYARSVPAVKQPPLPVELGPVLRALAVAGQVNVAADEIDHAKSHPLHVAAAPTADYGRYLSEGCKGCHGQGFSGGKIPGAPPEWKPAANITPSGIGHYSLEDFSRILRTGRRPDGSAVDSLMPWRAINQMTDVEIEAIYRFLKTVPARPYGTR